MEAVWFTWLLAWRVGIGVYARPLCGCRGSRGCCRDMWSALAIAVTSPIKRELTGMTVQARPTVERDPLVAALARYVEALHRRYPEGPEQMRREGLDGRANITRMQDPTKASAREATAALARRHPRPPGGPLDPRVHGGPVRPLRPGQPARAAGSLHRAPRPRRHRARLPGGPQRDHRLALADDGRDARPGAGRGLRPAPRRLLRPLAAQPAPDPRAPGRRPAPGRGGPRHVRPADPLVPIPTTGTSWWPKRPEPRSTAAGSRSGSPRATPPSSSSTTTRAATPASASGDRRSRPTPWRSTRTRSPIGGAPLRALRPRQRQREQLAAETGLAATASGYPAEPPLQRLDAPAPRA